MGEAMILKPTFRNEKHFTKSVRKAARQLGWLEYHTGHTPDKDYFNLTSPGFPDLVMVKNTRLIFAELKMEKGKLTEHQDHWLKTLRGLYDNCLPAPYHEQSNPYHPSISVYVWRPGDWDDILEILGKDYMP